MARARVDDVESPGEDAGLRTTEQLVAGEGDDGGAGRERLAHRRFVAQPRRRSVGEPRARRIEEPRAEIDEDRWADRRDVGDGRLLGEAGDAVVRLVDLQQHGDVAGDAGVVVAAGAVRRADLDQPRPRLGHHLGNTKAAADLDELTARDRDSLTACKRGQGEQHGGGAVVHDERGFGAARPRQQCAGSSAA